MFEYIPQSYELVGLDHPIVEYFRARAMKMESADKSYWLVKPGENSNRGRGIIVCHDEQ